MEKATRNKILIGVGVAIVTAIGIGAAVFALHIREITSVAQSAGMDQETVTALEEESAQLDQDLRSRFGITDNNNNNIAENSENPNASDQTVSEDSNAETPEDNSQITENNPQPENNAQITENNPQPENNAQIPENNNPQPENNAQTTENNNPQPEDNSQIPENNPQPENNAQIPENNAQTVPANTDAPTPTVQPATPTLSPDEEKLKDLIQQMYDLRDTFSGHVDAIINECIAEFLALDPSEQTKMNKIRIVSARLGEVADMEDDCDNQVADIVSQIREIDPALANQVEQQYQNEKALKKASLINQYGG